MISEGRGTTLYAATFGNCSPLHLRPMVPNKSLAMPCFAVPVDHRFCRTGISPKERAFTIQSMMDLRKPPRRFCSSRPHLPSIARDGGVLQRPGHTEATVDLVRMAGMTGASVLCEICSRDGRNMATGDELMQFAETFICRLSRSTM